MRTLGRIVFVVVLSGAAGCDTGTPTQPMPSVQLPTQPSPVPVTQQQFEVTGIVTDQQGTPLAGARVTMALRKVAYPHWPSTVTDAFGNYRISFAASPREVDNFLARAEVSADGYEEYWRGIMRGTGSTTFVENFRLELIRRIAGGESIVFLVPRDLGECIGWVAEACPIVRVTIPKGGRLTIEVDPIGHGAVPPVEVCCVDGNEVYGNPITVPVAPGPELEVKVGLRRGFTTNPSFLVKTSFEKD